MLRQLRLVENKLKHFLTSRMYMLAISRDSRLSEFDELCEGASHAYKFFHQELSVARDVSHLENIVSEDIFNIIREERENDESNFAQIREKYSDKELENIEWVSHECFLCGIGIDHEPLNEVGQNFSSSEREWDADAAQAEYIRFIRAYRVEFNFQSELKAPWIEGSDVRDDTIEFTAKSFEDGLGDWYISRIS